MQLQSNNINKVRVLNIGYIEILLQAVFRILFCIPILDLAGKYLCSGKLYSIRNQWKVDSYIYVLVSMSQWLHQCFLHLLLLEGLFLPELLMLRLHYVLLFVQLLLTATSAFAFYAIILYKIRLKNVSHCYHLVTSI